MPTSDRPVSSSCREAIGPIPLRLSAATLGALAAMGGLATLLGWLLGIYRLTDWWGNGIAMKANTAVAALASGVALAVLALAPRGFRAVQLLGCLVAMVGGLTLLEHFSGIDLHIDELLAKEPPGARATASPGRMGPPASSSFLLLGTGLVLLAGKSRYRHRAPLLALGVVILALLSVTGYIYGAETMYSAPRLTGISVQAAVMILSLALGLLMTAPDLYPVRLLCEDSAAGLISRRLLPIIVLLPLAVGWVRLIGQDLGFYDTEFGAAMRSVVEITLLAGLLWWTAAKIRDHEAALRKAEMRKDEFLATLAHELRNPLAPVMNSLALLKRQADGQPAVRDAVAIMDRQLLHLVRLIDDLLDVSRITRGKLELRVERVAVAKVVEHAVEMTRPFAEALGHEVTVNLAADEVHLDADPARLAQALGNILHNACRYTQRGGHIQLSIRRQGDHVEVSIADNGIGIPPQSLEVIFEMFSQVDRPLERTSGGLGIGLHLVQQLVQMHGGSVHARSDGIGKGSEFVLRLPLAATGHKQAEPVRQSHSAPSQPNCRVLVVDDNRDAAMTLAMLLRVTGYETETAFDGLEGIAKAASFEPDVILLDIGLPKMSGYDVCRQIRATSRKEGQVIIALTGWGQEDDRRQAMAAGFDAHLTKPVDHDELARTLREQTKQKGACEPEPQVAASSAH